MEASAQLDVEEMSRRIQRGRSVLLRIASVLVGVLLVLLGLVLSRLTLRPLLEWSALTLALRITIAVWVVAGPVALVCGVWLLVGLGRPRLPLCIGSAAIASGGAMMILGVLSHFIPCAGPT